MGKKRDFVTFIKCGQYSDIAELKALSDDIFGPDSTTLKEFRRYYYHHTPTSYYIAVKKKPPFKENDKGQIIGFLIYQFLTEKETEELVPKILEKKEFYNNVPSLRILKIGIMEEHRNKSIGKFLIKHLQLNAREVPDIAKQIIVSIPKDDTSGMKYLLKKYETGFMRVTTLADQSVLYSYYIENKERKFNALSFS